MWAAAIWADGVLAFRDTEQFVASWHPDQTKLAPGPICEQAGYN